MKRLLIKQKNENIAKIVEKNIERESEMRQLIRNKDRLIEQLTDKVSYLLETKEQLEYKITQERAWEEILKKELEALEMRKKLVLMENTKLLKRANSLEKELESTFGTSVEMIRHDGFAKKSMFLKSYSKKLNDFDLISVDSSENEEPEQLSEEAETGTLAEFLDFSFGKEMRVKVSHKRNKSGFASFKKVSWEVRSVISFCLIRKKIEYAMDNFKFTIAKKRCELNCRRYLKYLRIMHDDKD